MLSEILKLLRERGQLSLLDLSIHFRMDVSALEPIMDVLIRKEKAIIVQSGCTGGSCSGCSCSSRESMLLYTSVNDERKVKLL